MKISVVIPVRNGAETLGNCLRSIREQNNSDDIEIIILDSISSDNSREIALEFGALIIPVVKGEFNHGLTRNLGVQHAKHPILFFTVQDAWLSDKSQLSKMAEYFQDNAVDAIVGHQAVPWGDLGKNPAAWYKPVGPHILTVRHYPDGAFSRLSTTEQFKESYWDNVNAMYRRSTLLEIPFAKVSYSEDWIWANQALSKGKKLLRDASLVVYHYHHMTFGYIFRTKFIITYHFHKYFGEVPNVPWSPISMMRAIYIILKRPEVLLNTKPYWIIHNVSLNFAVFLAVSTFKIAYILGDKRLVEKVYANVCRDVPQGKLKSA